MADDLAKAAGARGGAATAPLSSLGWCARDMKAKLVAGSPAPAMVVVGPRCGLHGFKKKGGFGLP